MTEFLGRVATFGFARTNHSGTEGNGVEKQPTPRHHGFPCPRAGFTDSRTISCKGASTTGMCPVGRRLVRLAPSHRLRKQEELACAEHLQVSGCVDWGR